MDLVFSNFCNAYVDLVFLKNGSRVQFLWMDCIITLTLDCKDSSWKGLDGDLLLYVDLVFLTKCFLRRASTFEGTQFRFSTCLGNRLTR